MLEISSEETTAVVLGLWLIRTSRIYSGGFPFFLLISQPVQHTNYFRAIFKNVIGPILRRARCGVRRIGKRLLRADIRSPAKPRMVLKNLFLVFLVAEPHRCSPLGAGKTRHGWKVCCVFWNQPLVDTGSIRGITGFSDHKLQGEVTPGPRVCHLFIQNRAWTVFLRSEKKEVLHPWWWVQVSRAHFRQKKT